jgi:hypothetical protein
MTAPIRPKTILSRIEFENARLKRLLDQHDQAVWRGGSIKAALALSDAKLIRDELNRLEELFAVAQREAPQNDPACRRGSKCLRELSPLVAGSRARPSTSSTVGPLAKPGFSAPRSP